MGNIWTQLFRDAKDVEAGLAGPLGQETDAVVLFSLGIDGKDLVPAARSVPGDTPVLLADC